MRMLRNILGIVAVAVLLGCLLFFFGPPALQSEVNAALEQAPAPQVSSTGQVSFTVLAQGSHAFSIADRTNYRITSLEDLKSLWALIYGTRDEPTIPQVDFSRYEVLAVFDGSHSTDGYSITIQQVNDENLTRTVTIQHGSPAASCPTNDTVTSPFEVVEVPKTENELAHKDLMTIAVCSAQ